jgi:hypothetical protein
MHSHEEGLLLRILLAMRAVDTQWWNDRPGFVHRIRVIFVYLFFGELGNMTSLYPNDRFVTG